MFFKKILFILLLSITTANAAPAVVVTINPIHALTSGIMQGVAEPTLLVSPGSSPHNYALKPSQVSALHQADLVIWVGETLETFLSKTLTSLPEGVNTLTLLTLPNIDALPARHSDFFESDGHDHTHGPQDKDPHIWLDPIRAQIMVNAITQKLIDIDPDHKTQYEQNANRITQELSNLNNELAQALKPIQNKPFIVFHDAYQYFEKRYNLNAVAAITVNPEIMPSAHHLNEITQLIQKTKAQCIFAEPQFQPAIVERIAKASNIHQGVLDPIGPGNIKGFAAYPALLMELSKHLQECLTP